MLTRRDSHSTILGGGATWKRGTTPRDSPGLDGGVLVGGLVGSDVRWWGGSRGGSLHATNPNSVSRGSSTYGVEGRVDLMT